MRVARDPGRGPLVRSRERGEHEERGAERLPPRRRKSGAGARDILRDLPAPGYAHLLGAGLTQDVELALAMAPKLRARLAARLAQP